MGRFVYRVSMMNNLPADDQPPAKWFRDVSDEEALAGLPDEDSTDPVIAGVTFCNALTQNFPYYRTALKQLVTPESLDAWGDFSEAAAFLNELPEMAFGSKVNEAVGAPDVVYFKILRDVTTSYEVVDEQPINAAAVLTLIWRPERKQWLVHSIGDYSTLENLPRTAQ